MPSASLVTNRAPDYTRVFSGQWRLDASVPDYTRGLHDQHGQWLEKVRQSGAWAMALPWISLVTNVRWCFVGCLASTCTCGLSHMAGHAGVGVL